MSSVSHTETFVAVSLLFFFFHSQTFPTVRPTNIELTGSEEHADQGEEVTLTCIARGAKPAANVTWQNSSEPIQLPVDNKFQAEVSGYAAVKRLFWNIATVLVSLS